MTNDRRQKVLSELRNALQEVERALAKCRAGEQTSGTLAELEMIERELRKMIATLDGGALPPRGQRTPGLWHIITDGWDLHDPLGERIVAAELAYDRL